MMNIILQNFKSWENTFLQKSLSFVSFVFTVGTLLVKLFYKQGRHMLFNEILFFPDDKVKASFIQSKCTWICDFLS